MARPADLTKAYTVAVAFLVVGGLWAMLGRGDNGVIPTIALGLITAGGLGVIAAAFTSIRTKRRDASNG